MFYAHTCKACSSVAVLVSTKRTAALSLASQLHLQDRACQMRLLTFTQKSPHSPLKIVLANVLVTFTCKSASPLKNVLAQALSTFTRKSTNSQDRACKCTFDFHSEVTSPLKNVLASALLTFTPCQVISQDVLASAPYRLPLCTLSHLGRVATVARFSFRGAVILLL